MKIQQIFMIMHSTFIFLTCFISFLKWNSSYHFNTFNLYCKNVSKIIDENYFFLKYLAFTVFYNCFIFNID